MLSLRPLPIDPLVPEALALLERENCLVLQASPGCGKTTRLPPALMESGFCRPDREVLVLEPRRLAAKLAAGRVAWELGEPVGKTVGYQFRFEKAGGPQTRLRFLTEGMLLRRLLGDPRLKNVGAVVLDEFHERHLQGDVALAYLRQLQKGPRPDLRLVVMSATLDTQTVARFLDDCPTLNVHSPQFPVAIEHIADRLSKPLDQAVHDAVRNLLAAKTGTGDILVFLPGMAEIRRAEAQLTKLRAHCDVFPLHGALSKEEQERALAPAGKRKVILSTNVAESSLTIEGVDCVIDSGLHRIASYSWWSGVPSLRTRPTSRASAIQRAGRAGRTGPGSCLRLFPKHDFDTRPAFETPEIQRVDICQTLLELKVLGVPDESQFPWFEAPAPAALEAARGLLYRLGALDRDECASRLTDLGNRMASIPAAPRLARLMLEAHRRGVGEKGAALAALIAEGDLGSGGVDAWETLERAVIPERVRRQFLAALPSGSPPQAFRDWKRELAMSALAAFPDRVARRRGKTATVVLASGGSAQLESATVLAEAEYFVTLDVQQMQALGQRTQLKVRSLMPIEPEWLFELSPVGPVDEEELRWEADKVVAVSRLRYDQLTLEESQAEPKDRVAAARVLWKAGLGVDPLDLGALTPNDWVRKLSPVCDPETLENTLARLLLLPKYLPKATTGRTLAEGIESIVEQHLGLASLREIRWEEELPATLIADLRRFETWLPRSVTLPGGRKAPVQYRLDREPWIESRLQDFFGMERGPALLDGKLPLTLHLLAPNHRAVQVTTDLAGFWDRAYPTIRKELSRKYPRHAWPEDPRHAQPPVRRKG